MIYQPRKGKTFLFERAVRVHLVNCRTDYRMVYSIPALCRSDWGRWCILKQIGPVTIENVFPQVYIRHYEVFGRSPVDDLIERDRLN